MIFVGGRWWNRDLIDAGVELQKIRLRPLLHGSRSFRPQAVVIHQNIEQGIASSSGSAVGS